MDDLISRRAALDALIEWYGCKPSDFYVIEDIVAQLSSVDAAKEERKRGNWVGIDDEQCETFECDVCGFVLDDWIEGVFYNYCPNCGADMRGGQDG